MSAHIIFDTDAGDAVSGYHRNLQRDMVPFIGNQRKIVMPGPAPAIRGFQFAVIPKLQPECNRLHAVNVRINIDGQAVPVFPILAVHRKQCARFFINPAAVMVRQPVRKIRRTSHAQRLPAFKKHLVTDRKRRIRGLFRPALQAAHITQKTRLGRDLSLQTRSIGL